ncbi:MULTISPECIES: DUF3800 domain-containing protein [Geodermatophilaceae]|uniref:DUF3800 domain-containing protein n=1 Tax=Geodermatophilaceae TaxID=85030 RepID=UPI000DE9BFBE|nr:DUF3800 domain-containing protein [Blastococcus sp. TF02A-26]RBY83194.1 hypothetical protein DQ240_17490 [Blastococcus sp. TF02A-26]
MSGGRGPGGRAGEAGVLKQDHRCATAFLDESGAIPKDQIFGVGLLKAPEPSRLLRALQKERDRYHWYKEFKFSDVTVKVLPMMKSIVDVALQPGLTEFWCFIADRHEADPIERFGSAWGAYGKLAEQLVTGAIHPDGELVSILADNYSTPDTILFEEELKRSVNRRLARLAVTSVCRLDSKAADGLQMADILTSAVAFEFRAALGFASPTSPKGQLAAHVRQRLGATSCLSGWRNAAHSVALYEHGSWTPPPPRRKVSRRGVAPRQPGAI